MPLGSAKKKTPRERWFPEPLPTVNAPNVLEYARGLTGIGSNPPSPVGGAVSSQRAKALETLERLRAEEALAEKQFMGPMAGPPRDRLSSPGALSPSPGAMPPREYPVMPSVGPSRMPSLDIPHRPQGQFGGVDLLAGLNDPGPRMRAGPSESDLTRIGTASTPGWALPKDPMGPFPTSRELAERAKLAHEQQLGQQGFSASPGTMPDINIAANQPRLDARPQPPPQLRPQDFEVQGPPITPEARDRGRTMAYQGALRGTPEMGGGASPFGSVQPDIEAMTEDAMREKERRRLEMWRGVAEGLGGIQFENAGTILNRVPQPDKFYAENIRADEARLEDEMTPAERLFYEANGIPVPQGVSKSFAKSAIPAALRMQTQSGVQDRFERSADLREREIGERQGRHDENIALRERQFARVPDLDRRGIEGIWKAKDSIKRILDNFDPNQIGPIQGRWNVLARAIGIANPEAVRTAGELQWAIMQQVYEASGKQINQEEMRRISQGLPAMTDNPETFLLMLETLDRRLDDSLSVRLNALSAQQRDIAPFQQSLSAYSGGDTWDGAGGGGEAPPAGYIEVIDEETGERAFIPPDQLERAGAMGVRPVK